MEQKIRKEMIKNCNNMNENIKYYPKSIQNLKLDWVEIIENTEPKFSVKCGNKKLPKTTIILNNESRICCSGETKNCCSCCDICYNNKMLWNHKAQKNQLRNQIAMKLADDETLFELISAKITLEKLTKNNEVKLLRLNEVGEIANNGELKKFSKLADKLFFEKGIKTYTYSSNHCLDWNKKSEHLVVNGSGYKVDNEFVILKKIGKNKVGINHKEGLKIVELNELKNNINVLCCGDCSRCNICTKAKNLVIGIWEH